MNLDSLIEKYKSIFSIINGVIVVFNSKNILYEKKLDNTTINIKTIYKPWGCISKLLTDLSLRETCFENSVSLDTPISKIINFRNKDSYIEKNITIWDCLCHNIYIPLGELYLCGLGSSMISLETTLDHLYNVDLGAKYRMQTFYNNMNYVICGAILEKLSGMNYSQYSNYICSKYNLNNTNVCISEKLKKTDFFYDYKRQIKPPVLPALGTISNVEDIIRFGQLFLDDETFDYPYFNRKTVFCSEGQSNTSFYGNCGAWFYSFDMNSDLYFHNGFYPGISSIIAVRPKQNIGLYIEFDINKSFIVENLMHSIFNHFSSRSFNSFDILISEYMKVERLNNIRMFSSMKSSFIVDCINGKYINEFLGVLEVFIVKDNIKIRIFDIEYNVVGKNNRYYFYLEQFGSMINIVFQNLIVILYNISSKEHEYIFYKI